MCISPISRFRAKLSTPKCIRFRGRLHSDKADGSHEAERYKSCLRRPTFKFFSKEGRQLGSRISLEQEIHATTKLPTEALRGQRLSEFSVKERMSWAARRSTTLEEDRMYCLQGICGVLPLIYSQGEAYARLRLEEEMQKRQNGNGTEHVRDLTGTFAKQQLYVQANEAQSPSCCPFRGTNALSDEKLSFALSNTSSTLTRPIA